MLDVDEHGGAAPPPPVAAAAAAAAVPAGASDAALQPSAAGHDPLPWPQGLPLLFLLVRSFVTPTPSTEHRARTRDADSLDIECS